MREILFRGKATENYGKYKIGDWVYGNFMEGMNKNDCCINPKGTCNHIQVDTETVGEYTGLTDLNEKEIFEGDILKKPDNELIKVVWCEENACFSGSWWDRADNFYEWLVVGNEWDNPEMLKEMIYKTHACD